MLFVVSCNWIYKVKKTNKFTLRNRSVRVWKQNTREGNRATKHRLSTKRKMDGLGGEWWCPSCGKKCVNRAEIYANKSSSVWHINNSHNYTCNGENLCFIYSHFVPNLHCVSRRISGMVNLRLEHIWIRFELWSVWRISKKKRHATKFIEINSKL